MELLKEVGKRMKFIRVFAGIKQKDLASELEIPAPLLSMYEKGAREPSLEFIHSFASRFEMNLSQFFMTIDNESDTAKPDIANMLNQMQHLMINLEKETLKARA